MSARLALFSLTLLVAAPAIAAPEPQHHSANRGPTLVMPDSRFWTIIAESIGKAGDQPGQAAALRASLASMTPDEIKAFVLAMDRQMERANLWDLWGAGFVVEGGMSDDGFIYFRYWLISCGEQAFNHVISDADSLGDLISQDHDGSFEFEEFGAIPLDVWAKKTGQDPKTIQRSLNSEPGDPVGTPFREDPAALKKRYPRLWARFGAG